MYSYTVKVKINNGGSTQNVTIRADTQYAAKQLAEMQYGKANIVFISTGSR